ncbi:MAG: ROK family protein [candidate division KSB1 bacterium]|nr:ROK family protein [candidate division KSB1 bacterium]MDZ7364815.1 ROK family protein [candidate division KSB1 bacterium]MDZ7402918.1 ROK family protein [candidate division KSB1 bacterium]
MNFAIGFDLGVTNIKLVTAKEDGTVLKRRTEPSHDDLEKRWAEQIRKMINAVESKLGEAARWIGLAAPGLAARDHLVLVTSIMLPLEIIHEIIKK